jgi:hypothetical protein
MGKTALARKEWTMRSSGFHRRVLALLFVFLLVVPYAEAADIRLDAITVEPASPHPAKPCTLKVHVTNSGTQAVSFFKFSVVINGEEVRTYKNQLYVVTIDAGKSDNVELYNFSSPSVAQAFAVQITLVEAQWVRVQRDGKSSTTTPTGLVPGLPTSRALSVQMPAGD